MRLLPSGPGHSTQEQHRGGRKGNYEKITHGGREGGGGTQGSCSSRSLQQVVFKHTLSHEPIDMCLAEAGCNSQQRGIKATCKVLLKQTKKPRKKSK
jgi:hypothetical protein